MRSLSLLIYLLLSAFVSAMAQDRTVSGRILTTELTCVKGKMVPGPDTVAFAGATIRLFSDQEDRQKGVQHPGTVTDADGWFSLEIPAGQASSYKYLKITGICGASVIPDHITLPDQTDSLGNIVVGIWEDTAAQSIYGPKIDPNSYTRKPAIYLYPEQPTEVTVKNDYTGTIGTTYPEYGDGWTVRAQPGGQLLNLKDNRTYEYLFWDGTCHYPPEHFILKDGFVVPKAQTATFLRDNLELVGLNAKEVNDFIVYWLPRLREHACNFIHFRINDDIDHTSVLTVTPEPDSRIRLFMEFQPVDADLKVPEQQLHRYPRKGFTLVEWGGARLGEPLVLQ